MEQVEVSRIYTALTRKCPACGGKWVYSWHDVEREKSGTPEQGGIVEWKEGPCEICGETRRSVAFTSEVPDWLLWVHDEEAV